MSGIFMSGWTDCEGNSIVTEGRPPIFINPKNDQEWSSRPYNKAQWKVEKAWARLEKAKDRVIEHLTRTGRSIRQELELIKSNKSTLPRYARDFLLEIENNSDNGNEGTTDS